MELRVQKFQKEAMEIVNSNGNNFASSSQYKFSDFSFQQNVLTFKWTSVQTGKACRVSFLASDDYPDNSVITQLWEPQAAGLEKATVSCTTVDNFFKKIGEELLVVEKECERMDMDTYVGDELTAYGDSVGMTEGSDTEFSDCLSHVSDDIDDFDQNDYYADMDSFGVMAEIYGKGGMAKIHPLLQADMEMLKDLCSDKVLSYRLLDSIGEIDVELKVPLNFTNFSSQMAKAWKVNLEEPLVVRIHFSSVNYLDAQECPKIEVFQVTRKNLCGIAPQMKNILDGFLHENWREVGNTRLRAATTRSQSVPDYLSQVASGLRKERCDGDSATTSEKGQHNIDDQSLAKLIDMGFEPHLARNALIISRGSLEEASNLLASDISSCEDMSECLQFSSNAAGKSGAHSDATPAPKQPWPGDGDSAPSTSAKMDPSKKKHASSLKPREATSSYDRQHSHPHKSAGKKKQPDLNRSKSMGITASQTEPSLATMDYFREDVLRSLSNVKEAPSLENGFLVMMFKYARQRIPTLNEFCVVCDEPHVFQNGAMLMPAVCSRELCVFAYQTLGVMVDAAADIATGAEVVDLLIAMTRAAIESQRKGIIFEPFPNIVDPSNPKELAISEKNKDYKKLETLVSQFPPMKVMTSFTCGQLHTALDSINRLLFPLLTWIISSNRSHIVKLPPDRQIKFMVTPHQFLLLNSPPAKEALFQAAKEQYGSTFAFHGSSIENWHSIIRIGLLVASGTKRQVNGAAYGSGIYLSPLASMSFGYSRMGYSRHNISNPAKAKAEKTERTRFLSSQNLNCIALCEVIKSPYLRQNKDIWVCPDPNHVCTRFFFVYEDGQVGDSSIDMSKESYKHIVQEAMTYIVKT